MCARPQSYQWPATVNTSALAGLLGVSAQLIRRLAGEGRIPRTGPGVFPLLPCVHAYVAELRGRDPANLKERELTLKCELLEQRLEEQKEGHRRDAEKALAHEIISAMQIIRAAYLECKLPADTVRRLKAAYARAIKQIEAAVNE